MKVMVVGGCGWIKGVPFNFYLRRSLAEAGQDAMMDYTHKNWSNGGFKNQSLYHSALPD